MGRSAESEGSADTAAKQPAAAFLGREVGHFRLVRLLGEGAFGAVYEAQHTTLGGRRAAIKILHPQLSLSEEIKRRFINEADSASRTDHENIVQVFDGGVTADGLCYVVMELLKGQSLAQLLRGARGGLGAARTCNLGAQVAGALAAAHALGIVHRDLKPDNLVVVPREANPEFVKVLDFGIAKLQSSDKHTQTGMWLGTPAYMCPEQWQTLPDIDGRADIYALGVILFECLTGARPYSAPTPFAWLTAHLSAPIPDPGGDAPPALRRLVMAMMAKDRAHRPQTMREVAQALRGVLAGGPQAVAPVTQALPTPPRSAAVTVPVQRYAMPSLAAGRPEVAEARTLVTPLPQPSLPLPSSQGEVVARRPPQKRRGLLALGGALALVGVVLGTWRAVRSPRNIEAQAGGGVALTGGAAASGGSGAGGEGQPRDVGVAGVDEALPTKPQEAPKKAQEASPVKPAVPAQPRVKLPEELAVLGPGTFLMGVGGKKDRAEGPAHAVQVDRFAIQRREVSMADYRRFTDATGLKGEQPWDGVDDFGSVANLPVNQVTRAQAQAYCSWRYAKLGGRLPTEAEWEFTARSGGAQTRFPWGAARPFAEVANVAAGARGLQAVDAFPAGATAAGVQNLLGNVAEWVADDAAAYPGSVHRPGARGVVRGGGADTSGAVLKELSATSRRFVDPERGDPFIGVRCATRAE